MEGSTEAVARTVVKGWCGCYYYPTDHADLVKSEKWIVRVRNRKVDSVEESTETGADSSERLCGCYYCHMVHRGFSKK